MTFILIQTMYIYQFIKINIAQHLVYKIAKSIKLEILTI